MKRILCLLLASLMLFGLCACGQSAAPAAGDAAPAQADAKPEAEEIAQEVPDVEYRVSVLDTEGNPIPGVKVQLCDETSCRPGYTDDAGAAVFTAKEGVYTLHVVEVPQDYIATDEEFSFPGADREIRITLGKLIPTVDEPAVGFSYYNPGKYEELKGVIDWEVASITEEFYVLFPVYYAVSKDDSARLEELKANPTNAVGVPFRVICVLEDEAEADELVNSVDWGSVTLEKIGTAKNLTCYLLHGELTEANKSMFKAGMGELYDEFIALLEDKDTFLSGIRLQKPRGETLLFEARDLDGNPVDLAEVYAGHKVTMVDVWETGCGPCKEELPNLEELNKSFEERGCQIVGICVGSLATDDAAKAKSILESAGVTYLNLYAEPFDHKLLNVEGYPTAYFVDSEGTVLTAPLVGAFTEKYFWAENTKALEKALSRLEE